MGKTAVMTDSNCGIMPSDEAAYGIHILPMPVMIDGRTYFEGVDITYDEFFKKQAEGADITTSQPSPGEVTDMWDRLLSAYDEVVFIPMSSGLSSGCQTAQLLAQEEPYEGKVFVVDNHRISVTQALAVLDAKKMADEVKSAEEIKRILEEEALDEALEAAYETFDSELDALDFGRGPKKVRALAQALGAEEVQVIGRRFVLYRRNPKNPQIQLG